MSQLSDLLVRVRANDEQARNYFLECRSFIDEMFASLRLATHQERWGLELRQPDIFEMDGGNVAAGFTLTVPTGSIIHQGQTATLPMSFQIRKTQAGFLLSGYGGPELVTTTDGAVDVLFKWLSEAHSEGTRDRLG